MPNDDTIPWKVLHTDFGDVPFYVITYDKHGTCTSPAALDQLIETSKSKSDVIVFSHGWNNDWQAATSRYERFADRILAVRRQHWNPPTRSFNPVLVGVFWPSTALVAPWEQAPDIAAAGLDDPDVAAVADVLAPGDVDRLVELVAKPTDEGVEQLAALVAPALSGTDELGGATDPSTEHDLLAVWKAVGLARAGQVPVGPGGGFIERGGERPGDPAMAGWNPLDKLRDALRATTVWLMKDRAGRVGGTGVADLIRRLADASSARISLAGHSFGAKVVLSAVANGPAPSRQVDSVLLLQPALSCFAFAANIEGRPGGYRPALDRVRLPIITTYSEHDQPLTKFFHLAVRRKSDLGEADLARTESTVPCSGSRCPRPVPRTRRAQIGGSWPSTAPRSSPVTVPSRRRRPHGRCSTRFVAEMPPTPSFVPGAAVSIDAFTGQGRVSGRFATDVTDWALATSPYSYRAARRPNPPHLDDWRDARVGWGLVLPERPDVDLATAADAPTPIQELVAARSAKVLRYTPGGVGEWTLRDYAARNEFFTPAAAVGTGPRELPQYLLIYATPEEIPWHVQYGLQPVRFVGRLDLTGVALERYVAALLGEWAGAACSYRSPVVWAVEHGAADITALMRDTVAAPIYDELRADAEMPSAAFVDGRVTPATVDGLRTLLAANNPALVVTSSHGMTGPLSDVDAMRASLGLPVDHDDAVLDPDALLAEWQPDGAVWFAQACCSAGSDSPSTYSGLFESGSILDQTLTAIAGVGATTSSLPRALLGAAKPARAFIGHVEPTFDWTLSFPPNRQVLTDDLVRAVYQGIAGGRPVGLAMSDYYRAIGSLLQMYERARIDLHDNGSGSGALDTVVYSRVTAHDRANTVIYGDPTVATSLPG